MFFTFFFSCKDFFLKNKISVDKMKNWYEISLQQDTPKHAKSVFDYKIENIEKNLIFETGISRKILVCFFIIFIILILFFVTIFFKSFYRL
jgi:hypothetical protein